MATDELANSLYERAVGLFQDSDLNHKNILKFLELSMELTELEKDLSGEQKKALAIAVVKLAVDKMIPDHEGEEYQVVKQFVDLFIDVTIDEIVEVNNGKLKLNVKNSRLFKCFSGCSSLCSRS